MRRLEAAVVLLLITGHVSTEDSTEAVDNVTGTCRGLSEDTCELYDEAGPFSTLLREWTLSTTDNNRQGRILAVPSSKGYYISDRIDLAPSSSTGPYYYVDRPGPHAAAKPQSERQSTTAPPPGAGKILNRPPNQYNDRFKPSPMYPPLQPVNQAQPTTHVQHPGAHLQPPGGHIRPPTVHVQPPALHIQPPQHLPLDRIDEVKPSPQKMVSETDLYLLGAIEKLVYRVDLMENRLQKLEQSVHYMVAGAEKQPEPCVANFTRIGGLCYHVSAESANWKGANYACRRLKANMLEINTDKEKKKLASALLNDRRHKGEDFWTGGLNPGLLWIWSHSARPVNNTSDPSNGTQTDAVTGEGRCLAWAYDPAVKFYAYRGQDCSLRHRYICEKEEDKAKLSNEIERVAKMLKERRQQREPKIAWTDDEPLRSL